MNIFVSRFFTKENCIQMTGNPSTLVINNVLNWIFEIVVMTELSWHTAVLLRKAVLEFKVNKSNEKCGDGKFADEFFYYFERSLEFYFAPLINNSVASFWIFYHPKPSKNPGSLLGKMKQYSLNFGFWDIAKRRFPQME